MSKKTEAQQGELIDPQVTELVNPELRPGSSSLTAEPKPSQLLSSTASSTDPNFQGLNYAIIFEPSSHFSLLVQGNRRHPSLERIHGFNQWLPSNSRGPMLSVFIKNKISIMTKQEERK